MGDPGVETVSERTWGLLVAIGTGGEAVVAGMSQLNTFLCSRETETR